MKLFRRSITSHQALAIFLAGAFLFGATFAMPLGMQIDEHGNMSNCPFLLEQTSVCSMGIMEHIAKWQQFFTVLLSQSDVLASIIFLFLNFVLLAIFIHVLNTSPTALALFPPIPKNKPEAKLFNHLATAFSQGILHPRIYEVVIR